MGCQIVDRKSVAPSSGNRRRSRPVGKNRNFDKNLYSRFTAAAGLTRGMVPKGIFNIYQFFLWGRPGHLFPQLKTCVRLIGFQNTYFFKKNIEETSGELEILPLDISYYCEFFPKYEIDFWLMVNKTVLCWDSLSHQLQKSVYRTFSYLVRGFKCD